MRKRQPYLNKAITIPNGIDTDKFSFIEESINNKKIILLESCGRSKKTHFHLDELADEILPLDQSIEIWMVGPDQIGTSTGRLKFFGPKKDIETIFRQADLMILLSKSESFGLVALEAMASGCLPIGSNDGGMTEIITHGVNGWLVSGSDKKSIISTIKKALHIRKCEKWKEMKKGCKKYYRKSF